MLHMEQNLSFDVVLILMRDKTHVRELAKRLNTNHMTISRALKSLYEQNIVDYKEVQEVIHAYYKTPQLVMKRFNIRV